MSHTPPDDYPPHPRSRIVKDDPKKYFWDNPQNVKRLLWATYAICAALVIADFVVDRHTYHPWEGFPAFYAIYGWAACVTLVLVAKELRKILIRSESYYDDV